MKAYVFPGQGAQFLGMGAELLEHSEAKTLFVLANDLLGFQLTEVMFNGTEDDLKETKITQPAIFLHSIAKVKILGTTFQPAAVAGHSLGEFSALVAAKSLSFEDGLALVNKRAMAMQKACEAEKSTMAAIVGLDDDVVEQVCKEIDEIVVAANFNSPGQVVISGSLKGIEVACLKLKEAGAKRALPLKVGGAFHSPLMEPAKEELKQAIENTVFKSPICPVYQNISAAAENDPDRIKENLINQLTGPVRWTQTINKMFQDGFQELYEVGGKGKVLAGLIKRINREIVTNQL